MGTRADFYVGRGEQAEWLGSVAWDGNDMPDSIVKAADEGWFRGAVAAEIGGRDDGTLPARDGWPWPWETSYLTDYVYAFDDGRTWKCSFDSVWWEASEPEPEDPPKDPHAWPVRGGRSQGEIFGPRSGVIVLRG